jgi:protein TonB
MGARTPVLASRRRWRRRRLVPHWLYADAARPPLPAPSSGSARGMHAHRGIALLLSLAVHGAGLLALSGLLAPPAEREILLPLRLLRVVPETAAAREEKAALAPPPAPPALSPRPARAEPRPLATPALSQRTPAAAAGLAAAPALKPAPVSAPGPATAPLAAARAAEPEGPSLLGGYQSRPVYPRAALQRGAEGETLLRVRVLASGRVREVRVERSAGHRDLDRAATAAVRRWRFEPFAEGVREAEVWVLIPIQFQLESNEDHHASASSIVAP